MNSEEPKEAIIGRSSLYDQLTERQDEYPQYIQYEGFQPLHDLTLVRIIDLDDTEMPKKNGLYIPGKQAGAEIATGIVLARGPGSLDVQGAHIEPEYEQGDAVFFDRRAAMPFSHNGEDLFLLRYDDVIGVLLGVSEDDEEASEEGEDKEDFDEEPRMDR